MVHLHLSIFLRFFHNCKNHTGINIWVQEPFIQCPYLHITGRAIAKKTRMHSSRMGTTRMLLYGGPPTETPLDRHPPVDRQTSVKTLPSQTWFAGGKNGRRRYYVQATFTSHKVDETPGLYFVSTYRRTDPLPSPISTHKVGEM